MNLFQEGKTIKMWRDLFNTDNMAFTANPPQNEKKYKDIINHNDLRWNQMQRFDSVKLWV